MVIFTDRHRVWFVSRAKSNMDYEVIGQHKPIKHKSIISDVLIKLVGLKTRTYYPEELRLIDYIDEKSGRYYNLITNNMSISAKTIADIYHERATSKICSFIDCAIANDTRSCYGKK